MKILSLIFNLTYITSSVFCQQDSLILNLSTAKIDKDNLKYSVKLEFISNKKNEISFQLEPRYVMPNDLDGIGLKFEYLKNGCYKSLNYSDVHAKPDYDIIKDNSKKMSFGDTTTIIMEIGSVLKSYIGQINEKPNFLFKGQHRIRAYRLFHDKNGYSTIYSNWLYINFDELR